MKTLTLTGSATLTAAAGDGQKKRPTFSMLAYSGGPLRVPTFARPVVIDLAGLTVGRVAVLRDHDLNRIVGQGQAEIRNLSTVVVEGHVTGNWEDAKTAAGEVIQQHKAGFEWPVSVHVEVERAEYIEAGKAVVVNGKRFVGPIYVVRAGRLREVSFVSVGADPGAEARIAARAGRSSEEGEVMDEVTTVEGGGVSDEVRAERERIGRIDVLCARAPQSAAEQVTTLRARAISGALSEHELAEQLLTLLRDSRPRVPAIHAGGGSVPSNRVLAAAGMMHLAGRALAEQHYGAEVCERAEGIAMRHLTDLCAGALLLEGRAVPRGAGATVEASFSTVALPQILGDVGQKIVLESYAAAPSGWRAFCRIVPVRNFHELQVLRPTFTGRLRPVALTGEIKHTALTEESVATVRAETQAQLLTIDRQSLVNDDGAAFADAARALGMNAGRTINDLVWATVLGGEAAGYFADAHGNLLDVGLDESGLAAAINAMTTQRDSDNRDLDLQPAVLAVPPALRVPALGLLNSQEVARPSNADGVPTGNVWLKILAPLVESRLANTNLHAAASDAAWYLFAGPAAAPVVVCFLDGVESPTLATWTPADTPDRFGYSWRIHHDFGCGLGDYRAAVKSAGA